MSRGGRNTKIHTLVDGLGNPLAFMLSSGADHDFKHAVPLLGRINIKGSKILGDKAYGAKTIGIISLPRVPTTPPPKESAAAPWSLDWHRYKERHLSPCGVFLPEAQMGSQNLHPI